MRKAGEIFKKDDNKSTGKKRLPKKERLELMLKNKKSNK